MQNHKAEEDRECGKSQRKPESQVRMKKSREGEYKELWKNLRYDKNHYDVVK